MISPLLFLIVLSSSLVDCAPQHHLSTESDHNLVALVQSPINISFYNISSNTASSVSHSADYPTSANVDTLIHLQTPEVVLVPQDATQAPMTTSIKQPLVMGYYPDWVGSDFPPEKIDFTRFDWIDFAFALPAADHNLTWDDPDSAPHLLERLVYLAHNAGKKVKLSIGGWTGSKYFSSTVGNASNRQVFAENIVGLIEMYSLDGVDIDWEYPGNHGARGNEETPYDTGNFLVFLELLRSVLPPQVTISAAVQTEPFAGLDGRPLRDVSSFAKFLDWIVIMNYDTWGSSPNPGPNAPLYDSCMNSTQPNASAAAAFDAWTNAGFPSSKIVLGVPSYGYVSHSNATQLRTRRSTPIDIVKRQSNDTIEFDAPDNQVQFMELTRKGALLLSSPPTNDHPAIYQAGQGFERFWDKCSATPFLKSSAAGEIIAYDDPESLSMKGAFAKRAGMKGINMFDIHGDTDQWHLIDAVRHGFNQ